MREAVRMQTFYWHLEKGQVSRHLPALRIESISYDVKDSLVNTLIARVTTNSIL